MNMLQGSAVALTVLGALTFEIYITVVQICSVPKFKDNGQPWTQIL